MNKLIVVTGGTKGIGRAILETFASEGFDLVACSRSEKDLEDLAKELKTVNPKVEFYPFKADVSKKSEVENFITLIRSLGRSVDILVNNAGVFVPGQIHSEEEGTLERLIETNLYSAYHLTRGLIKGMIEEKKGHIFNICSTASIMAYPNGGSYSISKFALLGFSKVLREEMKPHNIKVTSVLPGATFTNSWAGTDLPDSRFMKSEDVAKTILAAWQLSDSAVIEEILLRPQLGDI